LYIGYRAFRFAMLGYLGLTPPFRFARAMVALPALLAALAVIAAGLALMARGQLTAFGPRAAYFLYLLVLLVLALALLRWPRAAGALMALAVLEFAWGLGSYALRHVTPGQMSLLPPDAADPPRFAWHALLQAVPMPSLQIRTSNGLVISHTSEGTRGRDPAPGSLAHRTVIATYGGSATYDIAQSEGDTWSDRLADALGRERYFVVNHGVPGYTTAEHVIQTAFYQTRFGKAPRCAIYFVGWNDLRNAHLPHLDAGYADFHLPSQVDSLKTRRLGGSQLTVSPLLTVLLRAASAEIDTVRYASDPYGGSPTGAADGRLEAIYRSNVTAISAINRGRGVTTIWAGQIVNRAQLSGDGRYGWLPLVRDRDVWPLLQGLNALLDRTAQALGDPHVDLPPDAFGEADFADNGHFSTAGSRRFAQHLAPVVRAACR
jgi:hypothetical protein